ncbi:hypothetical protein [Alysiella filiformis]|uniref:Uncharacterized protein n=1 Tax=Alysiella filiformis DSM 16848 TaxID=1120981 RepID=A0A286E9S2_9NEIS|nr:hypothetical protein [Alysiella filiformis]QMT31381.1 hypothetical protein H3L97_00215 [Alysiella filiformis]UBQ55610.1 hypothetical protein JF568_08455 [Alysiella filiformis DSM 16848]SOD67646.1 hypothetical protein SAMN02746062_00981 [Alysiella filiformis DSM 16848]
MIIDLPLHVEQMIVHEAQKQGVSVAELITQKFKSDYPKGDIRRLKGIVKTEKVASIDEINQAIELGAVYGE